MARSRDISKVLSSNSTLATDAEVAASYLTSASANALYAPVAAGGLVQITPTSITATGGSGSISATGAVSFTGASAISVNGCFNETYNSYRVIINAYGTIASSNLFSMRARVSGSDVTSGYSSGTKYWAVPGTLTSFDAATGPTNQVDLAYLPSNSSDGRTTISIDIHNPFTADVTTFTGTGSGTRAGQYIQGSLIVSHISTLNSYTGFTIYPGSGTITGTLRVYGYRN